MVTSPEENGRRQSETHCGSSERQLEQEEQEKCLDTYFVMLVELTCDKARGQRTCDAREEEK